FTDEQLEKQEYEYFLQYTYIFLEVFHRLPSVPCVRPKSVLVWYQDYLDRKEVAAASQSHHRVRRVASPNHSSCSLNRTAAIHLVHRISLSTIFDCSVRTCQISNLQGGVGTLPNKVSYCPYHSTITTPLVHRNTSPAGTAFSNSSKSNKYGKRIHGARPTFEAWAMGGSRTTLVPAWESVQSFREAEACSASTVGLNTDEEIWYGVVQKTGQWDVLPLGTLSGIQFVQTIFLLFYRATPNTPVFGYPDVVQFGVRLINSQGSTSLASPPGIPWHQLVTSFGYIFAHTM
ncbi:hypothetical protein BD410DRAFT_882761, partial [Rickenella mellea]